MRSNEVNGARARDIWLAGRCIHCLGVLSTASVPEFLSRAIHSYHRGAPSLGPLGVIMSLWLVTAPCDVRDCDSRSDGHTQSLFGDPL